MDIDQLPADIKNFLKTAMKYPIISRHRADYDDFPKDLDIEAFVVWMELGHNIGGCVFGAPIDGWFDRQWKEQLFTGRPNSPFSKGFKSPIWKYLEKNKKNKIRHAFAFAVPVIVLIILLYFIIIQYF